MINPKNLKGTALRRTQNLFRFRSKDDPTKVNWKKIASMMPMFLRRYL